MMNHLAAGLFGIGAPELIVILLVVLVIFGPSQIPKLGKMFGKGVRDFQDATKKLQDDDDEQEQLKRDRVRDEKRASTSSRDSSD
ncbi:MAG: twin-arginine translocase TatA/TatE family subunit [Candidatus Sumerlaeota bacterium]